MKILNFYHLKLQKYLTKENILLAIYFIYTIFMISRHEPWRDEGQAWLIARDNNPIQIFNLMGYDGSPALWHYLLYVLNNILFLPYFSMFIVHSFLNIASVYLFVKQTKFTFLTKILFCGSYFISYEYNIIARNYVLMLILLLVWALQYKLRHEHKLRYAIIVALIAQTSLYGFMISAGLAISIGLEYLFESYQHVKLKKLQLYFKKIFFPLTIIAFALLLAYLQLKQPKNAAYFRPSFVGIDLALERTKYLLHIFFAGYTSITPDIFSNQPFSQWLYCFVYTKCLDFYLGIAIVVFSVLTFYKQTFLGATYLLITMFISIIYIIGFGGSLRHWGLFFLVFISFQIILKEKILRYKKVNIIVEIFIILLLSLHVYRSYSQISEDKNLLFSSAKLTAEYIINNKLAREQNISIYPSSGAGSIMPYLDRKVKFYQPETDSWGSYTLWSSEWRKNSLMGYTGALDRIYSTPDLRFKVQYFITNEEIKIPEYQQKVELIKNWKDSIKSGENFYIYKLK